MAIKIKYLSPDLPKIKKIKTGDWIDLRASLDISMSKMVNARYWNLHDLTLIDIESLRKQNKIAKRFKRTGLKLA